MKATPVLIAALSAAMLSGCSSTSNKTSHALLRQYNQQLLLTFEPAEYWAVLEGSGPVFRNPRFQDIPPRHPVRGTITLDREHHTVSVSMRWVLSEAERGRPEVAISHPANGTYDFGSIRVVKQVPVIY
jgi:hypothetical protein